MNVCQWALMHECNSSCLHVNSVPSPDNCTYFSQYMGTITPFGWISTISATSQVSRWARYLIYSTICISTGTQKQKKGKKREGKKAALYKIVVVCRGGFTDSCVMSQPGFPELTQFIESICWDYLPWYDRYERCCEALYLAP